MALGRKPVQSADDTGRNFIDKAELYDEIVRCQHSGECSNALGEMLMLMAHRYRLSPSWRFYSYAADLESAGLLNLLSAWRKFDPEKFDNPFAYLTQCLYHSFLGLALAEKKQRDITNEVSLALGGDFANGGDSLRRGEDD